MNTEKHIKATGHLWMSLIEVRIVIFIFQAASMPAQTPTSTASIDTALTAKPAENPTSASENLADL